MYALTSIDQMFSLFLKIHIEDVFLVMCQIALTMLDN